MSDINETNGQGQSDDQDQDREINITIEGRKITLLMVRDFQEAESFAAQARWLTRYTNCTEEMLQEYDLSVDEFADLWIHLTKMLQSKTQEIVSKKTGNRS